MVERRRQEARLRGQLPHTWHAFLGRFGGVTEIQAAAVEPLLAGRSALLCAPTASGKTEALMAPLVERLIQADRHLSGMRLLVVCPTRALCNDLERRIARPLKRCGWESDIKTGDSPRLRGGEKGPPPVVVTTPESLDSMLARRPKVLRHVGAIVLDEVHLLDGEARGDQLQMLVQRLRKVAPGLQVCGASATAAQSSRLAQSYCGEAAVVIEVESKRDRQIDLELVQTPGVDAAVAVIEEAARAQRSAKWLVFANRRDEVEYMAANLSGLPVFAHHGSLSRSERLRVEDRFLKAPRGICVATMTLELGVDIGDVDRVVCLNPPPNVASFSQRIGRGNRRDDRIKVLGLYSSSFDRARFEHLAACARQGRWFSERVAFRPGVIAQQAVSLMHQNRGGWISSGALHKRLPLEVRREWSVGECEAILEAMEEKDYLYSDSKGRYVADEEGVRDFERGQMHSHISAGGEVEIVDEATGRTLGRAFPDGEDGLLLGGRRREVTRVRDKQVFVETVDDDQEPRFMSRMGPRYTYALAQDLARFLGFSPRVMRMHPAGRGRWDMEHFAGTLWGQCLAMVMREKGFKVKRIKAFTLECRWSKGGLPTSLGSEEEIEAALRRSLEEGYRRFLGRLDGGPWSRFVPVEQLHRWVVACLDMEKFAEEMARFELREC